MVKEPAVNDAARDQFQAVGNAATKALVEPESLSDIDDAELSGYFHTEAEKHYKKIIWEKMYHKYAEEQAVKDSLGTKYAAAAMAKSRKEKQKKRAAEAKSSDPAKFPAESAYHMRTKKCSSRINYAVLDEDFDESDAPGKSKKARIELPLDDAGIMQQRAAGEGYDCDGGNTGGDFDDYYDDESAGDDYEDDLADYGY